MSDGQVDGTDPTDSGSPFAAADQSTSARNLLTVALQVFGLGLIARAVILLPQIATYVLYSFQSPGALDISPGFVVVMFSFQVGLPLIVGLAAIVLARRISARFYPLADRSAGTIAFGRVGPGDIYHVASFVMGVYILTQAVRPAVSCLAGTMGDGSFALEPWAEGGVNDLIIAAVLAVSGLALIFGGRGVSQAMATVPRDPDNVPVPQFSIRMLLFLGVAFAIVLGVLRAVVVGIR